MTKNPTPELTPVSRGAVRVKLHSYQPSKAEMEEPVVIRKPDGSTPTPEELARVALRPMNIIADPDA